MQGNELMAAEAPVQVINKDQITAAVGRMKAIVPDSGSMTTEQLTVIAQESILYRTVPGRDMHYFINKGKLQRVPDYKYLKNYATFKEQILSGDDATTLEDSYRPLSEAERVTHGVKDFQVAALCTITTERERRQFALEVKRWRDLGFEPQEALALTRETYGELGTSAVGVVKADVSAPAGWSPLQLAEKLAFKNAVNRKYGIPTADEMRGMAHRMAKRAMPEHWADVDPFEPLEVQAKLAQLEAMAEQAQEYDGDPGERLEENVTLLRGDDDEGIGDNYIDITPTDPEPEESEQDEPELKAKARGLDGSRYDIPNSPDKLLALINNRVEATYDHVTHLNNAIAKHLGVDSWQWPGPKDADGWRDAYTAGVEYAEAKLQPGPDLEDVFPREGE